VTIFSKQDVTELRRIIKETTGRELSFREGCDALHYLLRLTQLIWEVERIRRPRRATKQLSLFD
jgi:hypothetical protein